MQGLFQGLMGLGGGLLAQGQGNPNGLLQGVGALNQSMDPRRIAMMQQAKIAELQAAMQMDQMKRQQAQQEAYRTGLLGGPTSTGGAGGDQVAMQPGLLDQMNVSPIVRAMAQADPEKVGGGLLAQAMKGPEKPIPVSKGTALYDPASRATIFENKDSDPQSPIAKLQDDLKAGRITPEQYQLGVSKMGPAQTNITVGKELDKEAVKFYADLQKSAMEASASLPKIARARQLLSSIAQGATAPTVQVIKRYAKDLGLDRVAGLKDDVGGAEAMNALMIDMRLDLSQRLKGAITEKEQELLAQMVARQGNTVEGNLMILDQLENFATRQGAQAKIAREYRKKNNGQLDAGVYDAVVESGVGMAPPAMRTGEGPQAVSPQPEKPPVSVQSPADAANLPPGTLYVTPDGQRYRR